MTATMLASFFCFLLSSTISVDSIRRITALSRGSIKKLRSSITLRFVQSQIKAMGVSVFEIGAYKAASDGSGQKEPEMLVRTWDSESLVESIGCWQVHK